MDRKGETDLVLKNIRRASLLFDRDDVLTGFVWFGAFEGLSQVKIDQCLSLVWANWNFYQVWKQL